MFCDCMLHLKAMSAALCTQVIFQRMNMRTGELLGGKAFSTMGVSARPLGRSYGSGLEGWLKVLFQSNSGTEWTKLLLLLEEYSSSSSSSSSSNGCGIDSSWMLRRAQDLFEAAVLHVCVTCDV
jgi:hypothetical protein